MTEKKAPSDSLTTLQLQVDRKGQVHALKDAHATWILSRTIPLVNLLDTYHDLLKDNGDGLTALTLQADPQGQGVHALDFHALFGAESDPVVRRTYHVKTVRERYIQLLSRSDVMKECYHVAFAIGSQSQSVDSK